MLLWHKLKRRARLLFRRAEVEREIADELAWHLEQQARAGEAAGQSPQAARRAAALAFGGATAHRDDARDAWGGRLWRDAGRDLLHAGRQAARAPGLALAVVGMLGAGMAAAGLCLALVRAYLHRPLPVPEPRRLVSIGTVPTPQFMAQQRLLAGLDWNALEGVFAGTATWDLDGFTMVGGAVPEYAGGAWVSPGLLTLTGARIARGRTFLLEEYVPGSRVILISDALWRRRYGGSDSALGQQILLHSTDRPDETELAQIVGILAPAAWRFSGLDAILRPLGVPRSFYLARLHPGQQPDDAARALNQAIAAQLGSDTAVTMTVTPTLRASTAAARPVLFALLGTAAVLLLLAISSAGALLLARSEQRLHEFAVRRSLGATRGRLARQLLVEAGMLWAAAAATGLTLTAVFGPAAGAALERFARVRVPGGVAAVRPDLVVIGVLLLTTLLPFLLVMIAPTLRLWLSAGGALRPASRGTGHTVAAPMRRALVAAQVACAVALTTTGLLVTRSARDMAGTDPGFASDALLKGHLLLPRSRYPDPAAQSAVADRILEGVRAVPGVTGAALINPHPFRGAGPAQVACDGCGGDAPRQAVAHVVTPSWFATGEVPLLAGRPFDARDAAGNAPVAIVSASFARPYGGAPAMLGRRVRLTDTDDAPWLTVVGVAADIRKTFVDTLLPDLYVPYAQNPVAFAALMVRGGAPDALAEPVRRALAQVDPALALADVEPMAAVLATQRGPHQILAGFVAIAAVAALALSLGGLFAVVTWLTRLRRREFAVRAALGGTTRSILALVYADGARLLFLGIAVGIALALLALRLLRGWLFEFQPSDLGAAGVAVLLIGAVGLLALAGPAWHASSVPPARALREE